MKESGNYLAVKVREGYKDYFISDQGNVFGMAPGGNSQQVSQDINLRGCKVMCLISDKWDVKSGDQAYAFAELAGEIHPNEWNQWLIIEKKVSKHPN